MAIEIEPSGQACGATIRGVDLAGPLPDDTIAEIRAAWLDHLVVSFPDQHLTSDEFERLALRFGVFGDDPYLRGLPDHPHIAEVKREADEQTPIFADNWHSDWSFLASPPTATLLYGLVIPPVGGDTLYANQYLAYEALDDEMQARLDGLMGVHSARRGYAPQGRYGKDDVGRSMAIVYSDTAMATQLHPLVITHPETGRKALFLSPGYTIDIDGVPHDEAQQLLFALYAHQGRDEFVYRHSWTEGMLTMWDNRAVVHAATGGYQGHRRLLHRITITDPVVVRADVDGPAAFDPNGPCQSCGVPHARTWDTGGGRARLCPPCATLNGIGCP
jgi:taurine dioxygenase